MSGHDSKYFSTTKKGEIPELREELNSQYKMKSNHLMAAWLICFNWLTFCKICYHLGLIYSADRHEPSLNLRFASLGLP
ncbi:hypothetical protein U1Q18_019283 [Sarracenia purpurea var. burkii]